MQRCKAETTSSEFVVWMEYLKQDINAFHREDYFWANIARLIREFQMMFTKKPKRVDLEPFLLKFEPEKEKPSLPPEKTLEQRKRRWLAWAGIGLGKK